MLRCGADIGDRLLEDGSVVCCRLSETRDLADVLKGRGLDFLRGCRIRPVPQELD